MASVVAKDPKSKDDKFKEDIPEEESDEVFDEYEPQKPTIRLFEIQYLLTLQDNKQVTLQAPYDELVTPATREALYKEAYELVEKNNIPSMYKTLFNNTTTPAFDQEKFDKMNTTIADKLTTFETTIKEHEESGSEQDGLDQELERIIYLCDVLYTDYDKIDGFVKDLLKKTSSSNTRITIYFALAKYFLSLRNFAQYAAQVEILSPLVNKDGDWDARNRFNIYQGLNHLFQNNFTGAAESFINSIQTYSSTDLLALDPAMTIAALLAVIRSPRKDFITKIVDSPEIIQSLLSAPIANQFIQTIYKCQYKEFYQLLPQLYNILSISPYFGHLAATYIKEARCVAYKQFLYSFQYVKIEAFAQKFGVSVEFIEDDVSYLIANGKLNCKINAIDNIIEVVQINDKMKQFNALVDTADKIVSRVNRLTQQGKAL
eukprot:UN01191